MSVLSGLASILGIGGDSVAIVKDSVDGAIKLADNAFYTDQEKAENKAKLLPFYLELTRTINQESTGTALARRWFLMIITVNNLVFAYVALIAAISGRKDIVEAISVVNESFKLGWAFTAAVCFYFLTHVFDAANPQK